MEQFFFRSPVTLEIVPFLQGLIVGELPTVLAGYPVGYLGVSVHSSAEAQVAATCGNDVTRLQGIDPEVLFRFTGGRVGISE